ncbi:hypothetical protein C8J56DRAFT_1029373 [Mycena floridula]|nr:hypothetical protein C8J56DRAFT_1029373 [Mycena floridula]
MPLCRFNSFSRLPGCSLAPPRTEIVYGHRRFTQAAVKFRPPTHRRDESEQRDRHDQQPRHFDERPARSWDNLKPRQHSQLKKHFKAPRERISADSSRDPDPSFAEHLNGLFPGLEFPQELARRIMTHASHPGALYGHNAGLSFIGRRVLESYILLMLSASSHLKPSDDLEAIVARTVNSYVLGEYVGSQWGLGRAMLWSPSVDTSRINPQMNQTSLLRSVGLYKIQGEGVAAVVGGIFRQFGASVAHRVFHTRVLPHLLLSRRDIGLPEIFHGDARAASARMGGNHGPLTKADLQNRPPPGVTRVPDCRRKGDSRRFAEQNVNLIGSNITRFNGIVDASPYGSNA